MMEEIIKKTITFDSAHRVMWERFKCFNLHGHTYHMTLSLRYYKKEEIGYAIDFKEIKRVMAFVENALDHGAILCSEDEELISLCKNNGWKLFVINCNPTSENIASILYYIFDSIFSKLYGRQVLEVCEVSLKETPTSEVVCRRLVKNTSKDVVKTVANFLQNFEKIEYDARKMKPADDTKNHSDKSNN